MVHKGEARSHERWAELRFSIVGPLLASPPEPGQLQAELARLAAKVWRHPSTGEPLRFAVSTIERWLYQTRAAEDPVGCLRRKVRRDAGRQPTVGGELAEVLRAQHLEHPSWSYKLHRDNLVVVAREHPEWGPVPSYASLRRYLSAQGLVRLSKPRRGWGDEPSPTAHETRSYEVEQVCGLWHLDFHHGSRKILSSAGEWETPILLAILDDRSRLVCHAQWYLSETAETLIHGLTQAFLKRSLPRALLSDNGSPMVAAETEQGLARLSVLHPTTLRASPHQNGKQESFWGPVEARLIAMLEGEAELKLGLLNEATQAWVEMEYHHQIHRETGQTPLARWLAGPSLGRPCPGVDELRLAFTLAQSRTQRQSDGTISVEGTRFEIPSRFRHLRDIELRYARWDLRYVWLMDERNGVPLERLYPLDRARNAEGLRRPLAPRTAPADPRPTGIAPLLRHLMADYAATGLPPAYLPLEDL